MIKKYPELIICIPVILVFIYMLMVAKPFAVSGTAMSTGLRVGTVAEDSFIAEHLTYCANAPECYSLDDEGDEIFLLKTR